MSNEYNHEDTSKVTLWTIMPKRVYESTILKNGYYVCDEFKCDGFNTGNSKVYKVFKNAYGFMAKYMIDTIPLKYSCNLPKTSWYPVWAWYMFEGECTRPDLRLDAFKHYEEPMVQIEFVKNKDEIILSDEELWTYGPLNDTICSEDENEVEWYYNLDKKHKYFKDLIKKDTWYRIFDKDVLETSRFIQATTWIIRKEEITNVRYFNDFKKK